MQNCIIYADKAHASVTGKEAKGDQNMLILKNGEPIFWEGDEKRLYAHAHATPRVENSKGGIKAEDILIHDQYNQELGFPPMLAKLAPPHFPTGFRSDTFSNVPNL